MKKNWGGHIFGYSTSSANSYRRDELKFDFGVVLHISWALWLLAETKRLYQRHRLFFLSPPWMTVMPSPFLLFLTGTIRLNSLYLITARRADKGHSTFIYTISKQLHFGLLLHTYFFYTREGNKVPKVTRICLWGNEFIMTRCKFVIYATRMGRPEFPGCNT